MKRRIFVVPLCLLIAFVLLTLPGCSLRKDPAGAGTNLILTMHTDATASQPATEAETTAPENTTLPETTAPAETTQPEAMRLVQILRSDFPYYNGPSYDNFPVGTVEVAATYTIVEEVLDSEGNLWGRLKSGVGWVDLSLIERESHNMPTVTVSRASKNLLSGGNYYYCEANASSYAYEVAFCAHETLRNVSFFYIDTAVAYERGPELFHISKWEPGKPFVAKIYFPGPVALYGLEFTDQNGATRIYTVSESGRNGSVGIGPFYGTLTPAEPELEPWKTAYLNYIETLGSEKTYSKYSLVYVDSDDIPELFISGSCEASGCQVCTYQGGRVVKTYLRRLGGGSYIPGSGLVYNFNGNMGWYTVEIYRLSGSGFTCLFTAAQEDSYEEITNEAGESEYVTHSKYYITEGSTDTEVTEEEFYAAQAEIFDFSAEEEFGYGTYNYSTILSRIKNW